MTDTRLMEDIKSDNNRILEKIYHENRSSFINWILKYSSYDTEEAVELYQKAFIILYLNIKNEKLIELNSSLKTYLYAIAKNLLKELSRSKKNNLSLDDDMLNELNKVQVDNNILEKYENSHHKEIVRTLLEEIGDPCKTLLTLIFIQNYATEAVAEAMKYSDERVVRKRKSLCLRRMRDIISGNVIYKFLFD
jgi:RNA polymerase sigma factor (sigma-70 family)